MVASLVTAKYPELLFLYFLYCDEVYCDKEPQFITIMKAGSAQSRTESTGIGRNELLVIEIAADKTIQKILREELRLGDNGTIRFDNRYYSAVVSVRLLSEHEIQLNMHGDDFCSKLKCAPALAIVTSDANACTLARCKKLAEALSKKCVEATAIALYISDTDMSEEETWNTVRWGLKWNVEVVTEYLCMDDGLDVATRLARIFECAQWPHVSLKQTKVSTDDTYEKLNLEARRKDGSSSVQPGCDISLPTRLRRKLNEEDVSKLMDQLLVDDSSEPED